MPPNPPSQEEKITQISEGVYHTQGTQYGVASVPGHTHNGIDANQIPVQNLAGYYLPIMTYTPTAGATCTIDLSKSNVNHITMPAGNITIALSGLRPGQCFIILIKQDSVGNRTVTWFSGISWPQNTVPTLSTSANHWDIFGFEITSKTTFNGAVVGQNYQ